MLTPQEVSNHAFAKAVMGGYNMAMVDEFLDELTDDYTSLYKENAALKAKMKVLVDKVEEYRSTEDAMRAALLTAQKMADSMVAEAEEKKKSLLENAESEANRKIGALRDEVAQEERRLTAAKAETADFLARVRELYEREMKLLEELPEADLAPAAPLELAKSAADVSEIEKSIMDSFKLPDLTKAAEVEPEAEELAVEAVHEGNGSFDEKDFFQKERIRIIITVGFVNLGCLQAVEGKVSGLHGNIEPEVVLREMDEGAGDLLAAVKPEAGLAQGGVDIGGYGRGLTFAALASGHGHAFFHGNLKGLAVVGAEKGRGGIGLEP